MKRLRNRLPVSTFEAEADAFPVGVRKGKRWVVSVEFAHKPVLAEEVLEQLRPRDGGIYVDCTVGGGGHAGAILRASSPRGRLIGLDQDPEALEAAARHLSLYGSRVELIRANFADLGRVLEGYGIAAVDGVLFDLGVSSPQLDEPERGFTYREDAPLDMRMDPSRPTTAYHLVNGLTEKELLDIIQRYGEERWAGRIARFIVEARERERIETTGRLVEIIKAAIPAGARRKGPHPARRTFQALRIAVNDELGSLERGLVQAVRFLKPGGRVGVISFHSLEDRIVKQFFRQEEKGCVCPPEQPVCTCGRRPTLRVLTRRPITAKETEVDENPRARSAKLRVAERLAPGE